MNDNPTRLDFEEHFEHCEGSLYDGEDFAYWLAKRDVEVAQAERERIVSLLEDYAHNETWSWNDLLRKIKGEK